MTNKESTIKVFWVLGHCNIEGNEKAGLKENN